MFERTLDKVVDQPDAAIDLAAATAAGFALQGANDLQIIEGIGLKIAELLKPLKAMQDGLTGGNRKA